MSQAEDYEFAVKAGLVKTEALCPRVTFEPTL